MGRNGLRALQQLLHDAEGTPADPRSDLRDLGKEGLGSWGGEKFTLNDFSLDTGALLERLTRAGEVLARERRELDLVFGEILTAPPEERAARIAEPRFHSFSLADALLAAYERQTEIPTASDPSMAWSDEALDAFGDPGELPALALEVANRLDFARHPPALIEDLKARAWTAVGDAHLRDGDPKGAEQALREGVKSLGRGSGDLLVEARMLELEADLRLDSGATLEADALFRQATARLREANETGHLGRLAGKRRRVAEQAQAARASTGMSPHSRR